MADSRGRSVFCVLLLATTLSRCAARAPGPKSAAEPNPRAEQATFEAQGLESPHTEIRERPDADRLDLAKLSEAFGPAAEASPEQVARLGAKADPPEELEVQATVAARAESDEEDGSAEDLAPPAPPPPPPVRRSSVPKPVDSLEPPPPPLEDPSAGEKLKLRDEPEKKGEAAAPAKVPQTKALAKEDRDFGRKEPPKDDDATGADAVKAQTLLPAIARRPALGKILVRGEDGKTTALVPRAVRVVAHVQGPRARTVVDYVFENPNDVRLEGTFYHPLPADASPAGFSMFDGTRRVESARFFESAKLLPKLPSGTIAAGSIIPATPDRGGSVKWGRRQQARVVEQKRAREVYEEIVRKDIDPALLEWSGGSNFEARVFPIEPKSLKRVVVAYEQPLVFDGERYRYGYTMPSEASLVERAATFFVDQQHGEIVAAPASVQKSAKKTRWARFDVPKAAPGAALEIAVRPNLHGDVLRGEDRAGLGGEAFYAQLRPELPTAADRATNRAIIMLDTSLSSEEGGAHARRAALIEALLEKDTSIEEYAVMLFDVRPRWLHGMTWRPNAPANREETYAELRRVYLEGATSFAAVLDELAAQRAWAVDGAKTTVFLLSDGEITWGLDREEALFARHPVAGDVRWVTYRFGESSANTALFDLLSRHSGGQTVNVLSEADAAEAALAHRRVPVSLESVVVEGAPSADVVVAGAPRLVFPGQTLQIAGRLPEGMDATLVLTLASGGSSQTVRVPLANLGDEFAPRAWAELQTKRLIAFDDPRVDRMVVALSQHYRLANARASMLILESDAQIAEFGLKDERVDLHDLEQLRRSEADQRRADLLGLSLASIPDTHVRLLEALRRVADGADPVLRPQPLLNLPYVGGPERLQAELEYRRERAKDTSDILLYERIARARALAGDTAGAVRALSSTVELRPRDAEAMRLVGYALLAVAQYDVAVELFERIRLLRPFEAQSYLEEALALDAEGRYGDAARNYEIVLARQWKRHDDESKTTARLHYGRLLRALSGRAPVAVRSAIEARFEALAGDDPALATGAMDFQLTIHWSTDSVDIDLWVFEPSGEKCSYENPETSSGGHLLWDVTDGLGPEVYQASTTRPGAYDTLVHFYGSGAPRLRAPTALLMVVDEAPWSPGGAASRKFLMRMLPKRDAILMMRTDYFAGS